MDNEEQEDTSPVELVSKPEIKRTSAKERITLICTAEKMLQASELLDQINRLLALSIDLRAPADYRDDDEEFFNVFINAQKALKTQIDQYEECIDEAWVAATASFKPISAWHLPA